MPEFGQMGCGYRAKPLTSFTDLNVVPAHLALPHLAILRERPILEAIAPLPLHVVISILVFIPGPVSWRVPHRDSPSIAPELDSNLIVRESEKLLSQTVALLPFPFLG